MSKPNSPHRIHYRERKLYNSVGQYPWFHLPIRRSNPKRAHVTLRTSRIQPLANGKLSALRQPPPTRAALASGSTVSSRPGEPVERAQTAVLLRQRRGLLRWVRRADYKAARNDNNPTPDATIIRSSKVTYHSTGTVRSKVRSVDPIISKLVALHKTEGHAVEGDVSA